MKNKLCSALVASIMLVTSGIQAFATEPIYVVDSKPITVTYNADTIHFPDANPIIENGRTLVPLRAILERAKLSVDFDVKTRTVVASRGDFSIHMPIDKNEAIIKTVDKTETVLLDVPAKIMDDRTYVPIRFIAQALSAKVNWNSNYREVIIIDSAEWEQETTQNSAFLAHLLALPVKSVLQKNGDETYCFILTGKNMRLPFSVTDALLQESKSLGDALKALIRSDDMLYTNSVSVLDTCFSLYNIFYADDFFTTEKQRNGTVLWHYKPDAEALTHDLKAFFSAGETEYDEIEMDKILTELSQKLSNFRKITFKTTANSIQVPEQAYAIDEALTLLLESHISFIFG